MKSKQKQTVLIKAREDGRRFLTEHITSKDVCKLARICQRLSKYPRFYFHGSKYTSILVEYASKRIIGCLLIESERIWFAFSSNFRFSTWSVSLNDIRYYNNLEADSLLRNTNYQRLKDIFDDPLLAFRRANELLQDDCK
jgi:hypothetical protein